MSAEPGRTTVLFAGGGTGGHLYPGLAIARALVRLDPRVGRSSSARERGIEQHVLPRHRVPAPAARPSSALPGRPWENWQTVRGAVGAWRASPRWTARAAARSSSARAATRPASRSRTPRCTASRSCSRKRTAFRASPRAPSAAGRARSISAFPRRRACSAAHVRRGCSTPARRSSRRRALDRIGAAREPSGDFRRAGTRAARVRWQPGLASRSTASSPTGCERGIPDDLHLIWATGKASYGEFASLDGGRVRVREYLSPIADAYAAADLALARAGAMTTAELFAWGIPPIVVPLPTAAADHQTANARALAAAGAARPSSADRAHGRTTRPRGSLASSPTRAAMARLAAGAQHARDLTRPRPLHGGYLRLLDATADSLLRRSRAAVYIAPPS